MIGVLNLTIDKAPTNPSDKAKEFLTITITTNTIEERTTKFRAIDDLLNETFEKRKKNSFNINEKKMQNTKLITVKEIDISSS